MYPFAVHRYHADHLDRRAGSPCRKPSYDPGNLCGARSSDHHFLALAVGQEVLSRVDAGVADDDAAERNTELGAAEYNEDQERKNDVRRGTRDQYNCQLSSNKW